MSRNTTWRRSWSRSRPPSRPGNLQNNKASGDADAKKKIEALYNRLESGQDFATVAMNFSEDPRTAPNGGDMGFASESQLRAIPKFTTRSSKLKPDQFTDPLPVYDSGPGHKIAGYAIYKLIAREPAGQRELNDPNVRQAIHQTLHDARSSCFKPRTLRRCRTMRGCAIISPSRF